MIFYEFSKVFSLFKKNNILLSPPLEIFDMRKINQFSILALLILMGFSCNPFDKEDSIYKRPRWLAGKLFTQIKNMPELSDFARCLEISGYDTVINVSGSFTVFAPDNDAFDLYFTEHPAYNSVEDIPIPELTRMVKYMIVQNPWSMAQLRQLDIYGWIDSTVLTNDEPKGFKRETLLRDINRKYGVKKGNDPHYNRLDPVQLVIVDTMQSNWYKRQTTDSRKFAPIFYKEYLEIYNLNSDDYAFYFGRPFESAAVYFAGAKIIDGDKFAENGFIHVIDRVVEPLKSAYQILETPSGANSYTDFLNLVNTFPQFAYNRDATIKQPGAEQGNVVDSLFDVSYPVLTFSILNEKTSAPAGTSGLPGNVTIRYHNGLVAPTNAALSEFISEYLTGSSRWGSLQNAPAHIRRMVVNTAMAPNAIYPTDFITGYYNGENDLITLDENTIVQKQYGSNCTFIGVNKVIVPRAFTSVAGPIYLLKGYSRAMYAIEEAGLLSALKRPDNQYMLFVESDANLGVDSSLLYDPVVRINKFSLYAITPSSRREYPLTTNDLRNLILNHIGTEQPTRLARKEFIKNLADNYIIVNNVTGEVSGTAPTLIGYLGQSQTTVFPVQISTNADNGTTYDIKNWFSFSSGSIYGKISASYPAFHSLLVRAGLADASNFVYTFMSTNENYTVFVPSAAALSAYNADTLTVQELRNFVLMHFVQGNLIFTDGHKGAGYYETARVDERSTQYTKFYTKIYISPQPDVIQFRRKNHTSYLVVNESNVTNQTAGRIIAGTEENTFPTIVTNGVIHEIDKVLLFSEMDTE
jgi:uncharacterized surface protein with fasciclin (FAS1) repeats